MLGCNRSLVVMATDHGNRIFGTGVPTNVTSNGVQRLNPEQLYTLFASNINPNISGSDKNYSDEDIEEGIIVEIRHDNVSRVRTLLDRFQKSDRYRKMLESHQLYDKIWIWINEAILHSRSDEMFQYLFYEAGLPTQYYTNLQGVKMASRAGNRKILDFFLGRCENRYMNTVLREGFRTRNPKLVEFAVQNGAADWREAMKGAIRSGDYPTVQIVDALELDGWNVTDFLTRMFRDDELRNTILSNKYLEGEGKINELNYNEIDFGYFRLDAIENILLNPKILNNLSQFHWSLLRSLVCFQNITDKSKIIFGENVFYRCLMKVGVWKERFDWVQTCLDISIEDTGIISQDVILAMITGLILNGKPETFVKCAEILLQYRDRFFETTLLDPLKESDYDDLARSLDPVFQKYPMFLRHIEYIRPILTDTNDFIISPYHARLKRGNFWLLHQLDIYTRSSVSHIEPEKRVLMTHPLRLGLTSGLFGNQAVVLPTTGIFGVSEEVAKSFAAFNAFAASFKSPGSIIIELINSHFKCLYYYCLNMDNPIHFQEMLERQTESITQTFDRKLLAKYLLKRLSDKAESIVPILMRYGNLSNEEVANHAINNNKIRMVDRYASIFTYLNYNYQIYAASSSLRKRTQIAQRFAEDLFESYMKQSSRGLFKLPEGHIAWLVLFPRALIGQVLDVEDYNVYYPFSFFIDKMLTRTASVPFCPYRYGALTNQGYSRCISNSPLGYTKWINDQIEWERNPLVAFSKAHIELQLDRLSTDPYEIVEFLTKVRPHIMEAVIIPVENPLESPELPESRIVSYKIAEISPVDFFGLEIGEYYDPFAGARSIQRPDGQPLPPIQIDESRIHKERSLEVFINNLYGAEENEDLDEVSVPILIVNEENINFLRFKRMLGVSAYYETTAQAVQQSSHSPLYHFERGGAYHFPEFPEETFTSRVIKPSSRYHLSKQPKF